MRSEDSAARSRAQPIGKHRASSQANLLRVWVNGIFEEGDAREFYDRLAQLRTQYGSVYCIIDMSESGTPTPEARRHILERFRAGAQIDAFVYVRANLMIRTMITLITNAVRLVRGSFDVPMNFVSSDAEAYDWLTSHKPGPLTAEPDAKKPSESPRSS